MYQSVSTRWLSWLAGVCTTTPVAKHQNTYTYTHAHRARAHTPSTYIHTLVHYLSASPISVFLFLSLSFCLCLSVSVSLSLSLPLSSSLLLSQTLKLAVSVSTGYPSHTPSLPEDTMGNCCCPQKDYSEIANSKLWVGGQNPTQSKTYQDTAAILAVEEHKRLSEEKKTLQQQIAAENSRICLNYCRSCRHDRTIAKMLPAIGSRRSKFWTLVRDELVNKILSVRAASQNLSFSMEEAQTALYQDSESDTDGNNDDDDDDDDGDDRGGQHGSTIDKIRAQRRTQARANAVTLLMSMIPTGLQTHSSALALDYEYDGTESMGANASSPAITPLGTPDASGNLAMSYQSPSRSRTSRSRRPSQVVPPKRTINLELLKVSSRRVRIALRKILLAISHPYVLETYDVDFSVNNDAVFVVRRFCNEGSIRDQIYNSSPTAQYSSKYMHTINPKKSRKKNKKGKKSKKNSLSSQMLKNAAPRLVVAKGKPLPTDAIRMFGRQVLEALAYFRSIGYPYFHLHSGNVIIHENRACLTDYENSLFGFTSRIDRRLRHYSDGREMASYDVDLLGFGYMLYEMATGIEPHTSSVPDLSRVQMPSDCADIERIIRHIFRSADISLGALVSDSFFQVAVDQIPPSIVLSRRATNIVAQVVDHFNTVVYPTTDRAQSPRVHVDPDDTEESGDDDMFGVTDDVKNQNGMNSSDHTQHTRDQSYHKSSNKSTANTDSIEANFNDNSDNDSDDIWGDSD
jgi:hypothetical protein